MLNLLISSSSWSFFKQNFWVIFYIENYIVWNKDNFVSSFSICILLLLPFPVLLQDQKMTEDILPYPSF